MKVFMPGDWCLKKGFIFNYVRIYRAMWDSEKNMLMHIPSPFCEIKLRLR